jgi:hypothetical protein
MWRETDQSGYEDDEAVVYVVIEETEFIPSSGGQWIEGMKRKFLAIGETLTPTNDPDALKIAKTQRILRRRK